MKVIEINQLQREEFVKIFGNIVEHCPEIANNLYNNIPFQNVEKIVRLSHTFLQDLCSEEKSKILALHPDLAGKLADEEKLTTESAEEQKAAGLHNLTKELKTELNYLNKEYKHKFGFSFVICARENKMNTILKGLRLRLNNEKEQELTTGINEVKKICKLRIEDIVDKD